MICNICGSENLVKGKIYNSAGGSDTGFIADEASIFKKMFAMEMQEIQTWGCVRCGNLQLIVEFSEEIKKQHREFHRPPPSVTDETDREE